MPYDPHLAELMRLALAGRAGISERKLFGGYCWMLNGNMLCGVEVGRYMFRVGPDLHAEALARPGAGPMDITGKPMKGFVWVDADADRFGDAVESLFVQVGQQCVHRARPRPHGSQHEPVDDRDVTVDESPPLPHGTDHARRPRV